MARLFRGTGPPPPQIGGFLWSFPLPRGSKYLLGRYLDPCLPPKKPSSGGTWTRWVKARRAPLKQKHKDTRIKTQATNGLGALFLRCPVDLQREKKASFFGWLTLKGNPSKKGKKGRNPQGNRVLAFSGPRLQRLHALLRRAVLLTMELSTGKRGKWSSFNYTFIVCVCVAFNLKITGLVFCLNKNAWLVYNIYIYIIEEKKETRIGPVACRHWQCPHFTLRRAPEPLAPREAAPARRAAAQSFLAPTESFPRPRTRRGDCQTPPPPTPPNPTPSSFQDPLLPKFQLLSPVQTTPLFYMGVGQN